MICASCGAEYNEGIEYCADCKIPLIPNISLDSGKRPKDIRLVPIFEAANMAQLAVAKAILEGAAIIYNVKNEHLQNLWGLGSMGTGFNPMTGPIIIEVDSERADEAKLLLSDLGDDGEGESGEDD